MLIGHEDLQDRLIRSETEISHLREELRHSQALLSEAQSNWQKAQSQLQEAQVNWNTSLNIIRGMESSKFWKLRTGWLKLKKTLTRG